MTDEEFDFESIARDLGRHDDEAEGDLPPRESDTQPGEGLGEESDPVDLAEFIDDSELAKVVRERDEYLDALRRLKAEFENFRKRTARQQTELFERATLSLLERLLPVLDAIDLALVHAQASDDKEQDDQLSALVQVAGLLRPILEKEGLERIDDVDVAFDPTIHDAVAHLVSEESSPSQGPTVAEVMRPGYRLKGRVVRPAMVSVRG